MRSVLKRVRIIGCILAIGLIFTGCGNQNNDSANNTQIEAVVMQTIPTAIIEVEGYGTITAKLYPDKAPNTVNNFVTLANSGFYDGLTFHRVIDGFMIQGGDPNGNGTGGPGYKIAGEFSKNGFENNDLTHVKGILSMARGNSPDSAGSQFFIMTEDGTYLDGQYAAFGAVIDGENVITEIEEVETDENNKPLEDVVIKSIRVDTNGVEVPEVITIIEE